MASYPSARQPGGGEMSLINATFEDLRVTLQEDRVDQQLIDQIVLDAKLDYARTAAAGLARQGTAIGKIHISQPPVESTRTLFNVGSFGIPNWYYVLRRDDTIREREGSSGFFSRLFGSRTQSFPKKYDFVGVRQGVSSLDIARLDTTQPTLEPHMHVSGGYVEPGKHSVFRGYRAGVLALEKFVEDLENVARLNTGLSMPDPLDVTDRHLDTFRAANRNK